MKNSKLVIFVGVIILSCFTMAAADGKKPAGIVNDKGNITISGTGNTRSLIYKLERTNYLLTIKFKGESSDQFDAVSTKSEGKSSIILANGFTKNPTGLFSESRMFESYIEEDDTVNVEAQSDWYLSFEKFPLKGESLKSPATLKGVGTNISKTVNLKKGNATLNINCPDTKRSNFRVILRDAKNGEKAIMKFIATNAGITTDNAKKEFTDVKSINIPQDGIYFFEIIANGSSSWELNVNQ